MCPRRSSLAGMGRRLTTSLCPHNPSWHFFQQHRKHQQCEFQVAKDTTASWSWRPLGASWPLKPPLAGFLVPPQPHHDRCSASGHPGSFRRKRVQLLQQNLCLLPPGLHACRHSARWTLPQSSPVNPQTAWTLAPLGPFPHPIPRRSDSDLCAIVLGASLLPTVSIWSGSHKKSPHTRGLELSSGGGKSKIQDPVQAIRTGFW